MTKKENYIKKRGISILLIIALAAAGLFSYPDTAYAEKQILLDEVYYHLDMGIQVAYKGSDWESKGFVYGDTETIISTVTFPGDIEVLDAYPLESNKGSSVDLDGDTTSTNIPRALIDASDNSAQFAYDQFYKDYTSTSMNANGSPSSSGNEVTFSYSAKLNTSEPLEAVEKGKYGQDNEIWKLFGGKNNVENPRVKDAIENALTQGRNGTANGNKLYLVFCPTIIEYKKYITVGDLEAQLGLPSTAKQGETYTAADESYLDEQLTVDAAVLEKSYDGGDTWEHAATWEGTGRPGENTGESIQQKEENIGAITYRLTVTTANGQADTDEKIINIVDSREIAGKAVLELPPTAYEGHPVLAEDVSEFTVDGQDYSALRMYNENLATNSFSIKQSGAGTIKKTGWPSRAIAVFNRKGTYNVNLNVRIKTNGARLSDTKPIEVLKTPSIIDSLGGTQKQNRRQDVYADIATHPDYPIEEAWIKIENSETGESITHTLKDGTVESHNSGRIKSRIMATVPDETDEYFTFLDLPFLTKPVSPGTPAAEQYKYTIYVKDAKGDTDTVTKTFTVNPDLAPEPSISLDPMYLRDQGSNVATITAEDMTVSKDGDQVIRTWGSSVGLTGYADLSFGSGKKISFKKTGVGNIRVDLHVKDQWTEPTLQEYINPQDYLGADAQGNTVVGNVAPVVSLEPIFPITGELTIFAADDESYGLAMNSKATFLEEFLRNEMDVSIGIQKLEKPVTGVQNVSILNSQHHAFGYEGNRDYKYLAKAFAVDNSKAYIVEANWPSPGIGGLPTSPYKLYAYNSKTGTVAWSCNIGAASFTIGQDDTDTYLYIIYGNKTTIIDKKTGSLLADIAAFQMGEKSFVTENNIYTVKSDGIYAISRKTGSVRKASSAVPILHGSENIGIQSVRRLSGNLQFIERQGSSVYRSTFNLKDESISREKITDVPSGFPYQVTVIGFDTEGKVGLFIDADDNSVERDAYVLIFDKSNIEIKRVTKHIYGSNYTSHDDASAYTIPNAKGVFDVFALDYFSNSSRQCVATFYDINSSKSASKSLSLTGDSYFTQNLLFAKDTGSVIQSSFGSGYEYLNSLGYLLYDKAREYRLDKSNWTLTGNVNGLATTDLGDRYGLSSDSFVALRSPDNIPNTTANIRTKILGWNQNITDIVDRNVSKYLTNSTDMDMEGYLVIMDKENLGKNEDISRIVQKVKDTGVRFISSGLSDASGYLSKLTDSLKGSMLDTINGVADIRDKLIDEKDSGRKVLVITPNSDSGKMTKALNLDPATTYYYEYDIKGQKTPQDIFGKAFSTSRQNGAQSYLPNEKYYVQKSYFEDFGDNNSLNSFFTYSGTGQIKNGRYEASNSMDDGIGDRKATLVNSNSTTFIVPAGKTAVLSFDYEYKLLSTFEKECGAYIDGQLWDKETFSERDVVKTGTYIHTAKLGPGTHTLTLKSIYYGYGAGANQEFSQETRFFIDNLSVMILGTTTPTQNTTSNIQEKGNGWNTVKGSFTTPERIIDFGALPMTTYFEDFADTSLVPVMTYDAATSGKFNIKNEAFSYSSRSNFLITMPDNTLWKTYVNQSSSANGSGVYAYISIGARRQNGHFDSSKANYYKQFEDGLVALEPVTGNQTLCFNSGGGGKLSFSIADITIQALPNIQAISDNRYFLNVPNNSAPGGNSNKVYLPDNQFDKTGTVALYTPKSNTSGGAVSLQNLKIYKVVNGVKQYVSDEHFTQTTAQGLNGWQPSGVSLSVEDQATWEEKDENILVYKKGELVRYLAYYSDYEGDPSKKQYWRYTHEPFNDGPNPDAAVILDADGNSVGGPGLGENLPENGKPAEAKPAVTKVFNEPIERFYVDGKYTVQHWQEDDTSRGAKSGGNPDFDKLSNVVEITFYIQGGGKAPWITFIKTIPSTVKENSAYQLQIGVDDAEKDILDLRTEVYKKGKLIYSHTKTGITADAAGIYPYTMTGNAPPAEVGKYDVVCTVRDWSGAGIGSYRFTVISEGRITGAVSHTPQWDENRKKYNLKRFSDEINRSSSFNDYISLEPPRPRGTNVFWSGEKFMLYAETEGNPTRVSVRIKDKDPSGGFRDTGYLATLARSGTGSGGAERWQGSLWDSTMINKWGRKQPEELLFEFTANYDGGTVKTNQVRVIIDSDRDYWQLHRLW